MSGEPPVSRREPPSPDTDTPAAATAPDAAEPDTAPDTTEPDTATPPSRRPYALPEVTPDLPPPPPPDRHAANQGRWASTRAQAWRRAEIRAQVRAAMRGRRSVGG